MGESTVFGQQLYFLSESEFTEFENYRINLFGLILNVTQMTVTNDRQTEDICPPSALHLSAKQILTHS